MVRTVAKEANSNEDVRTVCSHARHALLPPARHGAAAVEQSVFPIIIELQIVDADADALIIHLSTEAGFIQCYISP